MNKNFVVGRLQWTNRNRLSRVTLVLALALLGMGPEALGQENARSGAVFGGLAGAVVGGVVGHHHKDQTAEGALIGGAVGAVAGHGVRLLHHACVKQEASASASWDECC